MKALKILIIVLINFVILIAIGAFALSFFLKTDKLKVIISSRISHMTGQHFVIRGKTHVSFFPVLGLQFQDAVFKNPKNFDQSSPMVSIKSGDIGLNIKQLLSRRIVIEKIIIHHLVVNLIQHEKLGWNVQKVDKKTPQTSASIIPSNKTIPAKTKESKQSQKNSTEINLPSIVITDAKIHIKPIDSQQEKTILVNAKMQLILSNKKVNIPSFNITLNDSHISGSVLAMHYRDGLKQMVLKSKIMIDRITTKTLKASNISMSIQGEKGIFKIATIHAALYGGYLKGMSSIDLSRETAQISLTANISDINMQSFLNDLSDINRFTGTGTISAQLKTQSFNAKTMLHMLNGHLTFDLKNGQLLDVDLSHLIRQGLSLIKQKTMPEKSTTGNTKFGDLTGTASIENGVMHFRKLLMVSDDAISKGYGKVNLVSKKINFNLETVPTGETDITIPIIIHGSFSNPKIRLNVEKTGMQVITKILKQKNLENELESLKSLLQ